MNSQSLLRSPPARCGTTLILYKVSVTGSLLGLEDRGQAGTGTAPPASNSPGVLYKFVLWMLSFAVILLYSLFLFRFKKKTNLVEMGTVRKRNDNSGNVVLKGFTDKLLNS